MNTKSTFWQAWRERAMYGYNKHQWLEDTPLTPTRKAFEMGLTVLMIGIFVLIANYPFYRAHTIYTSIEGMKEVLPLILDKNTPKKAEKIATYTPQIQRTVGMAMLFLEMNQKEQHTIEPVFHGAEVAVHLNPTPLTKWTHDELSQLQIQQKALLHAVNVRGGTEVSTCEKRVVLCLEVFPFRDHEGLQWGVKKHDGTLPPENAILQDGSEEFYLLLINNALKQDVSLRQPTSLSMTSQDLVDSVFEVTHEGFIVVMHLMLFMFVSFFIWVMGSLTGILWNQYRNAGALEPLAVAHHAPWVWYGYDILHKTFWGLVVYGLLVTALWGWGLPLNGFFALGLGVLIVGLSVLSGAWGMLVTVLFHSVHGRMWAQIVLSPLTVAVVWAVRMMVIWVGMKTQQPIKALAFGRAFLQDAPWSMMMAGGICLMVSMGVFWACHQRMGQRREGLRKAQ